MDPAVLAPTITASGSLVVSLVALGGVWWTSRRADARERQKHRRDQLTAAVGELLARVEEASRQARSIQKAAAQYERETGEPAWFLGKLAAEVAPAYDAFEALITQAQVARFKVELLEPQLEIPALHLMSWCLLQVRPAVLNEVTEMATFRKEQQAEMQVLIEAYRALR